MLFRSRRPLNAQNGFWVMTLLRTEDGPVWVNRGWIPAGADALSTPDLPSAPSGAIRITGYLVPYDPPGDNTGLPPGQVAAAEAATLSAQPADPRGYIQLATSEPAQVGLVPIPLPEIDEGRNLSYAGQWLLFAVVAVFGWFFFLRREAREDEATRTTPIAKERV